MQLVAAPVNSPVGNVIKYYPLLGRGKVILVSRCQTLFPLENNFPREDHETDVILGINDHDLSWLISMTSWYYSRLLVIRTPWDRRVFIQLRCSHKLTQICTLILSTKCTKQYMYKYWKGQICVWIIISDLIMSTSWPTLVRDPNQSFRQKRSSHPALGKVLHENMSGIRICGTGHEKVFSWSTCSYNWHPTAWVFGVAVI